VNTISNQQLDKEACLQILLEYGLMLLYLIAHFALSGGLK
jgi:hypothetical protein